MDIHNTPHHIVLVTLGGTVLSFVGSIHSGDILKTVVLASIGATTSFLLSLSLKWIYKKCS